MTNCLGNQGWVDFQIWWRVNGALCSTLPHSFEKGVQSKLGLMISRASFGDAECSTVVPEAQALWMPQQ